MEEKGRIPLIVGVTGHVDIREEDTERLCAAVRKELAALRDRYPHTPVRMLCSLAAGADLLCAETAEELEIPLSAALPLEKEAYLEDFSPEDRERMEHQLSRARSVYTVQPTETLPAEDSRDFRYRQAGIHVAEHCHILLALWDGEPDRSGCGTAAAVDCALHGAYLPEHGNVTRFGENTGVIHIPAPREGSGEAAGNPRWLGNRQAVEEALERTEEFNALAAELPPDTEQLLPEPPEADPALEEMDNLYHFADSLSMRFAKTYRRTLAVLAALGTLMTFSFLLYDNGEIIPMILACGLALALAALCLRQATRSACHRRYIEFRALAEAARVQLFLRYAGSRVEVSRVMTWTQQRETAWILCAICALNAAAPQPVVRSIRDCWVEKQRQYHHGAGGRTKRQLARRERLLGIAGKASLALYAAVLLYELIWGGLRLFPAESSYDPQTGRTVLEITLGTLSAGMLFVSGYYGKMSLDRKSGDHEKMAYFYTWAEEQLDRWGQTENLLEDMAREELTENGNWCSYQKDNAPEFNL